MTKKDIEIPEVIRKIDIVLHLFSRNSLAKDGLDFTEALQMTNILFENEKPKINLIDQTEFYKIVEKLMKDNFISNVMGSQYEATYEGVLTGHMGGYSRKYLEGLELQILQNRRDHMAKRMNSINFWIALATGVAALYYLTKLYWEHGWFHF